MKMQNSLSTTSDYKFISLQRNVLCIFTRIVGNHVERQAAVKNVSRHREFFINTSSKKL